MQLVNAANICSGPLLLSSAHSLQDDDPYVRKTAAVCVAKLFDINPELVEDRGFLDLLKVCISHSSMRRLRDACSALKGLWLLMP